jgi:quinol monooxygenase YgiN
MMSIIDATAEAKHPSWARIPIRMAQTVANLSHPPVFRKALRSYGGNQSAASGDANPRGATMSTGTLSPTVSLIAKLVAKPDEADEVSTFLADAVELANQEQGTIAWFALRTDTTTFWIVDAFPSDRERQAHLQGPIASALLANAERLLDGPPEILPAEVLAAKLPQ